MTKRLYFYKNLPAVPNDIKQAILNEIENWEYDTWRHNLEVAKFGPDINIVQRKFDALSVDLQSRLSEIYRPYFKVDLQAIVGKLYNENPTTLAVLTPHCDRARYTGITYVLETGGTNVNTCFYNEFRSRQNDMTKPEVSLYNQVTLDYKICIPQHRWHSYNLQNYHSVENIETTRVLLSFVPANNVKFSEFYEEHKDLLE